MKKTRWWWESDDYLVRFAEVFQPRKKSFGLSLRFRACHFPRPRDTQGEAYRFDDDPVIYEEALMAGDYFYSFQIDDIFGSSLYTDFEIFSVDDEGDIYFIEWPREKSLF